MYQTFTIARWNTPPTGLLLVSVTRSRTSSTLLTFLVEIITSAPRLCKKQNICNYSHFLLTLLLLPGHIPKDKIQNVLIFQIISYKKIRQKKNSTPTLRYLIFLAWYPVLTPDRDVSTRHLAPRSTSQCESSRPNPPRPPVMM